MKKRGTVYARIIEFSENAKKDNNNQKGLYLIGVESRRLIYGFSARESLEEAQVELRSKGYSGHTLMASFPSFSEDWI